MSYMMNLKAIGGRIRQLRMQRDVGQEELADIVGVSRSTIAGIETGRDRGGIETIVAIADYFKVSVDWILARPESLGGPPLGQLAQRPDEVLILDFWHSLTIKEKQGAARLLGLPKRRKSLADSIAGARDRRGVACESG